MLASLLRLVGPENFGLFAMVVPLMLLLRLGSSMGMNIATVQLPNLTSEQVSSAFWTHLALGGVMGARDAGGRADGRLVQPGARPACGSRSLWSGLPLASAVGLQHFSLLERNLRLGSTAVARLAAQFVGGVVAIYVAWQGEESGPWWSSNM